MKTHSKRLENGKRYFGIGFLLRGQSKWSSGYTWAEDEQSAIANFLIDFSPSMGTLVAVYAHLDDDVSLQVFKQLHRPVAA
jgi:hypothetical protein